MTVFYFSYFFFLSLGAHVYICFWFLVFLTRSVCSPLLKIIFFFYYFIYCHCVISLFVGLFSSDIINNER